MNGAEAALAPPAACIASPRIARATPRVHLKDREGWLRADGYSDLRSSIAVAGLGR
jgi:hypothetical protein